MKIRCIKFFFLLGLGGNFFANDQSIHFVEKLFSIKEQDGYYNKPLEASEKNIIVKQPLSQKKLTQEMLRKRDQKNFDQIQDNCIRFAEEIKQRKNQEKDRLKNQHERNLKSEALIGYKK